MNREIKFRAWHRRRKNMAYGITISLLAREQSNVLKGVTKEYDWMQYTGLKDKNGKEIYEGDIISFKFWNKSGVGKIVMRDGAFGYSYDCEVVDDIFKAFSAWDEPEVDCYPFIEVIGNIYETPHLLNKDQEVKVSDTTEAK